MTKNNKNNKILYRLFKRFIPFNDRDMFLTCMEQEYNLLFIEKGKNKADKWLWSHFLKSLPSFLKTNFTWSFNMFTNYLKVAVRNIRRHKIYSFINIFGLAVGMACFILILLYIRYEFSYENHHENLKNIYRINLKYDYPGRSFVTKSTQVPLGNFLKNEIPEIVDAARLTVINKPLIKYKDNFFYEEQVAFTDPSALNIFTFPLTHGDKITVLKDKYSVILSEKAVKKYFGGENPIGKTLNFNNYFDLTVTGILKNLPENSMFTYDFMVSFPTIEGIYGSGYMTNKVDTNLKTYVLLSDKSSVNDINLKINKAFKNFYTGTHKASLFLQALERIHLYSEYDNYGDIKYVYIFSVTALFIILIACINFMNLSTARSANRAREVGMRKVVGAERRQLMNQFFGETMILSIISFVFAIFILLGFLPLFRNLTEQNISIGNIFDLSFIPGLFVIVLLVGLISGSYPAFFLSSFKPVKVLKGSLRLVTKSSGFRKILVVVQFAISITLIICTFIVSRQLEFMKNKRLGFNKEQVVVVPLHGSNYANSLEPFKNELLESPGILKAAGSDILPVNITRYSTFTWEGAQDGEEISLLRNRVDYDFLDTYEIELIKGRKFSKRFPTDILDYSKTDGGAVILNEEAVKSFGWKSPVGKKVIHKFRDREVYFNVIGVIKNFNFSSLKNSIKPHAFFLRERYLQYLSIKVSTENINGTIAFIRNTWNRQNPSYPFEYYFIDETFDTMYRSEEKMQTIFGWFSFVTVFISCLGLFALASYAAEQRTKEIGIRKILGASVSNVILLLSKEFIKWVLIANVIAWPAAYYFMNNWLGDFAYRSNINISLFGFSAVVSIIIAVFTVSYQSIKAAVANPIDSLRDE